MDRQIPKNFKVEDLLTVADLAIILKVPESWIIHRCKEGLLPYYLNSENEYVFDINEVNETLKR